MRNRLTSAIAFATVALACCSGTPHARSQPADGGAGSSISGSAGLKLELTPAQRSKIYQIVSKDKSKATTTRFPAVVGANVPPMIALYALPDEAVADNPAAKLYQCTMVQDKVVVVDPTNMRVVDVIGPKPGP